MKVKKVSHSVVSNSLGHDMLLCPWNSPGRNTGVCCHFLFQKIFPTHGLNLCLLHCRQILYHLSHQASVVIDALNLNDSVHILLTNWVTWPYLISRSWGIPICSVPGKVKVLVAQLRPSLWDPLDCSQLGISVHGILQAGIPDWVVIPSPGGLPDPGVGLRLLQSRQILHHLSHQGRRPRKQ